MSKKLTFVVLGSNCFSGSYMVDELLKNPDNVVVGISRSSEKSSLYLPYKKSANLRNFTFYQVDMVRESDKLINLLDLIQPDYIINFAALSEVQVSVFRPVDYFQTNCISLITLCNQLRSRGAYYLKGFIQISSAEVYGSCEKPILESSPTNPSTPYAVSKLTADLYLQTLFNIFKFPTMIIRSTNVYGKHQQLYKIIPRTAIYLKTGHKIELHGNGQVVRCFLHIRDLVQGVVAAIQNGTVGQIYHFAVPDRPNIAEIVEKICTMMKYDFKANTSAVENRPAADHQYLLDYTKSIQELNWKPKISLNEGLQEVIGWVEECWDEIVNEPQIYIHKP